tara:strand:- start:11745 stop:12104 length:360 start_codon:yes stop_codon:yes gene_type:complete
MFSIHFFIYLCLVGAGIPSLEIVDTSAHLSAYSQVNEPLHDNIDDTTEVHSHTHKHTSEGAEHEHNHDHSKLTHQEIKIFSNSIEIKTTSFEYDSPHGFYEVCLQSNSFPQKPFRPPIA